MRVAAIILLSSLFLMQTPVPRIWNDVDLADWATPVAGLNVRPGHFTSAEYYSVPADNFRTYPVYPPDHEPSWYWEWLQRQKPEPLVDAARMKTTADWIAAGERAFREIDFVLARTNDPQTIGRTREKDTFGNSFLLRDGSVSDPRWVITDQGLMLTTSDCSSCHVRFNEAERSIVPAGPLVPWPESNPFIRPPGLPITDFFGRMVSRQFPDEPFGIAFWRTAATPWAPDTRIDDLRDMKSARDLGPLFGGNNGGVPRVNGSPFYGSKVPDLHLLRYYRYLDATGTHRLRGPEDIARYIAQVSSGDSMEFGPHLMLAPKQRRVTYRFADEVLYAIGVYLMSLEPEKNPFAAEPALVENGRLIFEREGCGNCHAPPNYTNGKLTPATGFEVPASHPNLVDVMAASLDTDPGLAMKTRKGTGFYKVPSLRGVWSRPFLLHDGSVTSLEEFFDAARLHNDYAPRGWNPPGVTRRAVPGHTFGLNLSAGDKRTLIAFLKDL